MGDAGTQDRPTYLIIGAAGGIGSALVRRLATRGARMLLAGRREEPIRELADEIGAEAMVADATDYDAVEALCTRAVEMTDRLDGVANLAGSIVLKPAHLTTRDEVDEAIAQNLHTAFATVRAGAQAMKRAGGSIVLMSSCAGQVGLPNHDLIGAAKAAVSGLTRSAAATYAPSGVRVNAVAPGLVDTPMAERLTSNDAALKASKSMHPLGRIGAPDEVAPVIDWLLGPESEWVTGQVVGVDGGISTVKARA
ncbi:MAG: SDR family NAD(P)-dependent oxidoreductase [Phycisphaerales bacterium]